MTSAAPILVNHSPDPLPPGVIASSSVTTYNRYGNNVEFEAVRLESIAEYNRQEAAKKAPKPVTRLSAVGSKPYDRVSLNWMFTLNNPTPEEDPKLWPDVKYGIYQLEKGANGTEHYQGYIVRNKNTHLSGLKKLNSRAHWEPRRGTHAQAVAYCSKEDTRVSPAVTWGDVPSQGKRNDLLQVQAALDSGVSDEDIAVAYFQPYCKYRQSLTAYRMLRAAKRDWKTQVVVVWGPTGTGKSAYCRDNGYDENGTEAFWKPYGDWWDGYESQSLVIMDEFYGWIKYSMMLCITDRYPLLLQVKGGTVRFVAKKIIITSNKHPRDWYPNNDYAPLERRIDHLGYLGTDKTIVWEKGSIDADPTSTSTSTSSLSTVTDLS